MVVVVPSPTLTVIVVVLIPDEVFVRNVCEPDVLTKFNTPVPAFFLINAVFAV